MIGGDIDTHDVSVTRPDGPMRPVHDRAQRALIALEDGRMGDVETNIAAIPDDTKADRAWACYLSGRLSAGRGRVANALEHLGVCCELSRDDTELRRLEAAAWECLGVLHRRREEPAPAAEAHEHAYRLRQDVGSAHECWESAHSLGLTAALRGDRDMAVKWLDEAMAWAGRIPTESHHCRAISLASLAKLELEAARMPQAIDAARRAFEAECDHDRGSVDAVRAELSLGHVLLRAAESLLATDPTGASQMLSEATEHLQSAKDGLLAFELAADPDLRWAEELLDFAERLRVEL